MITTDAEINDAEVRLRIRIEDAADKHGDGRATMDAVADYGAFRESVGRWRELLAFEAALAAAQARIAELEREVRDTKPATPPTVRLRGAE